MRDKFLEDNRTSSITVRIASLFNGIMSLIFERVRSLGSGGLSYLNFSGLIVGAINSGLASFIDSKFSVYNRNKIHHL